MGKLAKGLDISQIDLSDIYAFVDHGDRSDAPVAIVQYLDYMEKVRCMHNRIDEYGHRDLIVKHLVKVEGFSRELACRVHDDAMEYFHAERGISRDAYRNIIADKMMKNISLSQVIAKDVKDIIAINKSLLDLAKVLRLDQPDPIEIDDSVVEPWIIYSVDSEELGLPALDRVALKKQIAALPDVTDKVRDMVEMHAGLLPFKMFPKREDDAYKD